MIGGTNWSRGPSIIGESSLDNAASLVHRIVDLEMEVTE